MANSPSPEGHPASPCRAIRCLPFMEEMALKIHEGCILAILEGLNRVILHEEKMDQELQVINLKEKPAYQSSTGRLLLAQLDEPELKAFVNKYGLPPADSWPEVQDREDLLYELNKIRKRGYAQQTSKAHVTGFAMLLNWEGGIHAALGVYLPEVRLSNTLEERILENMKEAVDGIQSMSEIPEQDSINLTKS